jgi:hypothetical protein
VLPSRRMLTEQIVSLLIQERDKLNRAIEALQGTAKHSGRPPKKGPLTPGRESSGGGSAPVVKRTPFSAGTRRKMAPGAEEMVGGKEGGGLRTPQPRQIANQSASRLLVLRIEYPRGLSGSRGK